MKEQFYDLSCEVLEDGTIRLEQRDYSGESVIVDAHPQQIIHIARSVSTNAPSGTAERIATLERRLCWLRDRFEETYAAAPHDMFERCAEANEFSAWVQAGIDVANEYCADLVSVAGTTANAHTALQSKQGSQARHEPVGVDAGAQLGLDGV